MICIVITSWSLLFQHLARPKIWQGFEVIIYSSAFFQEFAYDFTEIYTHFSELRLAKHKNWKCFSWNLSQIQNFRFPLIILVTKDITFVLLSVFKYGDNFTLFYSHFVGVVGHELISTNFML